MNGINRPLIVPSRGFRFRIAAIAPSDQTPIIDVKSTKSGASRDKTPKEKIHASLPAPDNQNQAYRNTASTSWESKANHIKSSDGTRPSVPFKARARAMGITKAIQAAETIDELIAIAKASGQKFDKVNITAATVRAAKISFQTRGYDAHQAKHSSQPDQLAALLEILKPVHVKTVELLGAREISNIVGLLHYYYICPSN